MAKCFNFCVINVHQLAAVVRNHIENVLILDSRSFLEYNTSHITNAVNVGCAKLMKRRLQQDRLSIQEFLAHNCHWDVDTDVDIVVYDQNTQDPNYLPTDCFMSVFLHKLLPVYNSVNVLRGGFLEFQAAYPDLCEDEKIKFTPLSSLSQPCLPISDHGPTRILPFLYLGSQQDALNREVLQDHNITYELNVSTNCPKPDFIQEAHFMRIPVIDNYSEKILPHFPKAFQFLDKVRESGGCALVHCLAGMSRSATVAIAYVMRHMKMSSDEAYRYVKSKRATISPNFNFLGQLLEYENQLKRERVLHPKNDPSSPSILGTLSSKKYERESCTDHEVPENNATRCYISDIPTHWPQNCKSSSAGFSSSVKSTNRGFLSVEQQTFSLSLNGTSQQSDDKSQGWAAKSIPVPSLKELNFSQAFNSFTGTKLTERCARQKPHSWCSSDSRLKLNVANGSIPENGSQEKLSNFDFGLFDNILSECKSDTFKSLGTLPVNAWPVRTSSVLPQVHQIELDTKDYNRSDSTSTSGLGSEGSDCFESWNDYSNSCERENDVLMDEEYGTVPMDEDDEYQRQKMLGFTDSFEEPSLYAKDDDLHYSGKGNKSPISPSEAHLMTEFSEVDDSSGEHQMQCQDKVTSGNAATESCETKMTMKGDGLYRAQSCPGILFSESVPWTPRPGNDQALGSVNHRRRICINSAEREKKHKNRYSCSSLDYVNYTSDEGFLKSCPDVPSFAMSPPDQVSSISRHQMIRHSMIQVS